MIVRPATEDERATYVASTWAASWIRARRGGKASARRAIEALLRAQPVLVVPQPGTFGRAEDIAGWVCFTPLRSTAVVHYVYVREPRRRSGVARALLAAAGVDLARTVLVTCSTDQGDRAIRETALRVSVTSATDVLA